MLERVVCPVPVRREAELAVLEDALLAAHRGESRFVLLAGEAGGQDPLDDGARRERAQARLIGIAVGPAVLGRGASDANVAVRGVATNLAARLQAAAAGGEILLSDEAHRRVEDWLAAHGMEAERDSVELKGFEGAQTIFRIAAPSPAGLP